MGKGKPNPDNQKYLIELLHNHEVKARLVTDNKSPTYWSTLSARTRQGKTYNDPESIFWSIKPVGHFLGEIDLKNKEGLYDIVDPKNILLKDQDDTQDTKIDSLIENVELWRDGKKEVRS